MSQEKTPKSLEEALYLDSVNASRFISGRSIDPSTRNGAVVWTTKTGPNSEPELDVLAVGYNRMPPGVDETDPLRWERTWKYKMVSHGEVTAINHAARKGIALKGALLSSFNFPCSRCASYIVESGVRSVITDAHEMGNDYATRWAADIDMSRRIFEKAGVEIIWVSLHDDPFAKVNTQLAAGAQNTQIATKLATIYNRSALKLEGGKDAKLQSVIVAAERSLDESVYAAARKTAVLFDARGKILVAAAERPPLGTDPRDPALWENIGQFVVEPGRLVIAGAARQGIAVEGLNIYLSDFPTGQEAVALAGSRIKTAVIDASRFPDGKIETDTARDIWAARLLLEESGAHIHFINGDGRDVFAPVVDALKSEGYPARRIAHKI